MSWLWVKAVPWPLDCPRSKSRNLWCFVDAYFQEVVAISSLALWPIQAASTLNMVQSQCTAFWVSMMQDQESLTLCCRWFLGGGSDIVAAIFTHTGGQHFDYTLLSSHSCLIIQVARSKIVDADFQDGSMSVTPSFLPIQPVNTITFKGYDYAAICLPKM